MKREILIFGLFAAALCTSPVFAAKGGTADKGGNNECPVGLVSGMELDEEFGLGTQELTRCLERRHNVKVVIQVNQFCRDTFYTNPDGTITHVAKITDCKPGRAYALGNIANMLDDYEITHGMRPGKDFEVVAVVHSGGGDLILQNGYEFEDSVKGDVTISNPYQSEVEALLDRGVRFLFCQNTTRGFIRSGKLPDVEESTYGGGATEAMIPGIEYTTAGVTAIADLQEQGYNYVQP